MSTQRRTATSSWRRMLAGMPPCEDPAMRVDGELHGPTHVPARVVGRVTHLGAVESSPADTSGQAVRA